VQSASLALAGVVGTPLGAQPPGPDPLPSWRDGGAKQNLLDFVAAVTRVGGSDYVLPAERVAVFDNDGTLWSEMPIYFQFQFALDRVRALAPAHPEWRTRQPFKAALEGDLKTLAATGEPGIVELVGATHAGLSADEFAVTVADWLATARHPRFKRPYTDLVFQPMLEVLAYLRANGFKTFVASGGGIEFMRVWTEKVYGIPPEQVVGSSVVTRFALRAGEAEIRREAKVFFIDDKADKPLGIHRHIGRRPIAAFGNSDGDLQMLQYTTIYPGKRFGLIVHHTDAEREYAYDRTSPVGRLDVALDEAARRGWTVVDMQRDWKVVYSWQRP
jgi:phosphoglycolate phosphatase-like HAD superfamily hydrolase